MTRKRFVKLMMSIPLDRNCANVLADIAVDKYGSYETAYTSSMMQRLAKKWTAVNDVQAAFAKVVDVVAQCFSIVSETIRKAVGDLHGL